PNKRPAATNPQATNSVNVPWFMAPPGSALDGRRIERRAVGIAGEVHRQRDRRIRRELELGEALLAEAVVQPPLKRAQLALRHAVRRPGRVRFLRALGLGE